MLQVVEINAIEHLEAIRLRWTALLYETPGASFFHTLDWLKVYWQHFRDSHRLRVQLVHRGGTVIGILPLIVRAEATALGPVDVLTYPTIHSGQFYGPIGPNPTATLMASFRHLADKPRDWNLLSLAGIGEHDHGRTANALEVAGFCRREDLHSPVSKVCFDASWPDYLSELGTGVVERRHALDRESEIAGDITFERIRPLGSTYGDDQLLEGLVEDCFALDLHSSLGESSRTPSAACFRDLVTTASRLGMLDLNLLRLDGRPIAFSLNVHFDAAIQQICVGEAAASRKFHPASVLTLRMLQDSFSRKDRYIYLAASTDGFANPWATEHLPVARYQHREAMPLHVHLTRFGKWLSLRTMALQGRRNRQTDGLGRPSYDRK